VPSVFIGLTFLAKARTVLPNNPGFQKGNRLGCKWNLQRCKMNLQRGGLFLAPLLTCLLSQQRPHVRRKREEFRLWKCARELTVYSHESGRLGCGQRTSSSLARAFVCRPECLIAFAHHPEELLAIAALLAYVLLRLSTPKPRGSPVGVFQVFSVQLTALACLFFDGGSFQVAALLAALRAASCLRYCSRSPASALHDAAPSATTLEAGFKMRSISAVSLASAWPFSSK
jgi:hypothetical protein